MREGERRCERLELHLPVDDGRQRRERAHAPRGGRERKVLLLPLLLLALGGRGGGGGRGLARRLGHRLQPAARAVAGHLREGVRRCEKV